MVAIGVILAWLLTLLLLPILLRKYPISYEHTGLERTVAIKQELLGRYSVWLRRHRHTVTLGLVFTLVISGYGLSRIYFSENWSNYFSEQFEVTRAINLIKEKFNRLHRYELVLRSDQDQGVNQLEYLAVMNQLIEYLEQHEKVEQIQSYAYILKRLNQTMNNDAPGAFRLPESQPLAAQYLLLYELSLPQGMGIENFVSFDKSASRTSILLAPSESHELLVFERELIDYFVQIPQAESNISLEISGLDHIFSHIAERNITQMLVGTSIALVMISLLMMVIFKSVKYGIISLIPNLIPAFIAYWIWGATAGYIDLALSVVICMSLGIVVDDSVHFLSKYIRAKQQLGLNTPDSVDYSFHIVGKALVTTTVILVAGFATMMFSPLQPTSATGMLLCITLITALVVDFTLLPIVLNKFDDDSETDQENHSSEIKKASQREAF
jgi:predicted RND superfamily exporter protein